MMKSIIIVGAGGMARKLFVCLNRINSIEKRWNIKGCIDDNLHALDNVNTDLKIIGTIKDWNPGKNEIFAMGISDPKVKFKIAKILIDKGARFETIISPDVILGEYVEVDEGSVIMTPYNVESCAKIGKFVTLLGSTIALDGEIGDYSTTTGFANLTRATVGKGVYIGSHAVLLPGIKVGNGAYVGAGSVVVKDVEQYMQVFGSPARVIGKLEIFDYN